MKKTAITIAVVLLSVVALGQSRVSTFNKYLAELSYQVDTIVSNDSIYATLINTDAKVLKLKNSKGDIVYLISGSDVIGIIESYDIIGTYVGINYDIARVSLPSKHKIFREVYYPIRSNAGGNIFVFAN
jgi:hypothetical protein